MAQAEEHLPSKCEALIHSTTKKRGGSGNNLIVVFRSEAFGRWLD
jgi:hypothetical protein